ncbi:MULTISPECIES: RNA polymerase-binding protein RbpA [Microcella]|uniref:RNA polymerase-binding protein RbpA n=1 Tax=Microcella TaxID=337004 RepID=UPI0015CF5FD5|nr:MULTISPECIES: RNA polymerase-binding protein RbpA [Microcella]QOD92660.1 RNA polymerase-binding protein RbpA [Chryseoglobus sp. 28M-23]
MADRTLRGMRLGSQSMQTEEGVEFASRQRVQFRTADGETFDVIFASDAELPDRWQSPKSGKEGVQLSPDGTPVDLVESEIKAARTHWDMLLERRTRDELEELLEDRLALLRERRGGAARKGA